MLMMVTIRLIAPVSEGETLGQLKVELDDHLVAEHREPPQLLAHAPTEGWVRIYDKSQFLGVGEIQDDGKVAPRRMIQASA